MPSNLNSARIRCMYPDCFQEFQKVGDRQFHMISKHGKQHPKNDLKLPEKTHLTTTISEIIPQKICENKFVKQISTQKQTSNSLVPPFQVKSPAVRFIGIVFCYINFSNLECTKGFDTTIFLFSGSLQVWKIRMELQFCQPRQSRGGKSVMRFSEMTPRKWKFIVENLETSQFVK